MSEGMIYFYIQLNIFSFNSFDDKLSENIDLNFLLKYI